MTSCRNTTSHWTARSRRTVTSCTVCALCACMRACVCMYVRILYFIKIVCLFIRLTPAAIRDNFHAFNPEKAGLTTFQGVCIEALFAFNLVFVALSCHDTQHRAVPAAMPSLPIAWCIGIGIMAAVSRSVGRRLSLISCHVVSYSQSICRDLYIATSWRKCMQNNDSGTRERVENWRISLWSVCKITTLVRGKGLKTGESLYDLYAK